MRLVLWDIDHTLVATRGVGTQLFALAFQHVTGREMKRQARIDGMTDPVIFHETARLHGIVTSREDFERFAAALGEEHVRHAPALRERGHALPGAAAALSGIASFTDTVQTVVTGNIRTAAEVKLHVFGLDSYINWGIGAFGEDNDERAELVRTALDRAQAESGACVPASEAVLIGDTPSDVQAGHACGVRVIAVASGRSDEKVLRDAGAETALPDLTDTEGLLKLVQG